MSPNGHHAPARRKNAPLRGGAAGRFKNRPNQRGAMLCRSLQEQHGSKSVPRYLTKMPCRSVDQQGTASFHRRSPRKGGALQASTENRFAYVPFPH